MSQKSDGVAGGRNDRWRARIDRGRRLLERHTETLVTERSPLKLLEVLIGVRDVLRGLDGAVHIGSPKVDDLDTDDGRIDVLDFLRWTETKLGALAEAFDRRNGTSFYAEQISA